MPSLQSLLDQVEQATNEIVELEQSLVRIPSVNTGFMPTGGETADGELNHTWLTFTCDGWSVSRWLAVEPEQEPQGETDQETTPP